MGVSKAQEFTLFLLGMCYRNCSLNVQAPLKIELKKSNFIALAKSAGLVKKSSRAMYRNLELLESSKFLDYKNSRLSLTKKGLAYFNKKLELVEPFINVSNAANSKNLLKYTKKAQLRFND